MQSYSGSSGDEEPRSFYVGQQRLDILEVVESWRTPVHRFFKVKVQGAKFYVLRGENKGDQWDMTQLTPRR